MVSASDRTKNDNWQLLGLEMPWLAAFVFVAMLLLWVMIGWLPIFFQPDLSRAGVMGDSFGMVNSLFSGFGFTFAAYAIILQIRESHGAAANQQEQQRLMLEQTKIAAETARIQLMIREDGRRTLVMQTLLKVSRDLLRFRDAAMDMHPKRRFRGLPHDQMKERGEILDAYTEVVIEFRSNSLSVRLVFGSAGSDLAQIIEATHLQVEQWMVEDPKSAPDQRETFAWFSDRMAEIESKMQPLWVNAGELSTAVSHG